MNLDLSVVLSASASLIGLGAYFGAFRSGAVAKGELAGLKTRVEGLGASLTRAHDVGYKTASEVQDMHKELHKQIGDLLAMLQADRADAREARYKFDAVVSRKLHDLQHDISEIRRELGHRQGYPPPQPPPSAAIPRPDRDDGEGDNRTSVRSIK